MLVVLVGVVILMFGFPGISVTAGLVAAAFLLSERLPAGPLKTALRWPHRSPAGVGRKEDSDARR